MTSDVCPVCQTEESTALGKRLVCPDCAGHRPPPSALCAACVVSAFAASLSLRAPGASVPFRCNIRCALDAADRRVAAIEERKNRRGPMLLRKDIFAACPRMVELRRASLAELRSAPLRVKKHVAPADTSGLEDVLGQGGEVPSDGTSLFLMTAQFSGDWTPAGRLAIESVARTGLSRAPHVKYKYSVS